MQSLRRKRVSYIGAVCVWLGVVLSLAGCARSRTATPETYSGPGEQADDTTALAKIPETLRIDLERGYARDVLIELDDREPTDAGTGAAAPVESERPDATGESPLALSVHEDPTLGLVERYKQLQDRVLERMPVAASVDVLHLYENIPYLHVRVDDLESLLSLARLPEVLRAHEDALMEHQLAQSLPLIQQPAAQAAGKVGAGTAVAVLDTGCDFTNAAFGSCSSAGASGCKVAYAADFGVDDGSRDANGHGTNVSAIVLGVAPSTRVLALDVFDGAYASSSVILKAIDWVIANRATYNIVAMNMSLGGGSFGAACTSDVFATPIANARSAGVLSAIASGNNGFTQMVASPACVPAAISVGAVYDANVGGLTYSSCSDSTTSADKVTCFSNSAPFLSMLAPGAPITAGGYTMTGTSQATPHVAGAIAVARAAFPTESISATAARLTTTGPSVTDARNGLTLHRLDLNAALGGGGTVDVTPPTGTVSINGGAVGTRTAAVTLTLSASDDGGAVTACVSNTTTCTTFSALTTTRTWTLSAGAGLKTVYVTLRDAAGNRTSLTATIVLDVVAPTGGTLTVTPGNTQVQLGWTAATDAGGSGVVGYRVQVSSNSTTAPSCTTGTTVYSGSATSYTHTGLTNGLPYAYRVCPIDAAGNIGAGTSAVTRPAPELDAPTGTVSINQGAEYTNKAAVTLTLSAADASGVAGMCISNTTTCTAYVAFAATKAWTLATANGTATVRVWLKDIYGNVSATPVTDSIVLDSVVPTASTLSAVPGDAQVTLSWTTASDAISGVAGYKVVGALNTAPACTATNVIYSGAALTTTHTGLVNGQLYAYRVCPFDTAGNVLAGATVSARPAPEFDGPTGQVSINAGAAYTKTTAVTLSLSASDASGVAAVCVSNTTTCTAYSAFVATKAWSVTSVGGVATVRVWFKDTYGNVSAAAASDTILVDTTAPMSSTPTAYAGSGAVALRWTASSDAGSGLAGYRVRYAPSTAPTCATGTQIYSGTDLSFVHSGLTNGTTYAYRICPFDVAGNVATGGSVLATPR